MNYIVSYSDSEGFIRILKNAYNLSFDEVYFHREMIGRVYFVKASSKRFVLKLYRHFNGLQALQSIEIIEFLKQNNYPVVSVIPTKLGKLNINIKTPDGECVGILYDFIDGIEPHISRELTHIGQQIAELHNLMEKYPHPIVARGKEFYIDRFIIILRKLKFASDKIKDLEQYGEEIWHRIKKLPNGFCHGDLHSGNILQKNNDFILFDFDIASHSYSIIDVSTLCNDTNFNHLDESTFDSTMKMFKQFYQGYSRKRLLTNLEITSIFDFIAVRHYELIATITECQGLDSLSNSFLDQQYDWLMKWKTLCNEKHIEYII